MAHDVFLSYSSKDKPIADAVCGTLEGKRIRCWIAPREVLPGIPYGEAIVEAIEASRVMVLVFSSSANNSPQVMRIEQVPPSKSLEYFLSAPHWLDALTPPLEKHLHSLAETVHVLLIRHGKRCDSREGEPGPGLATVEEGRTTIAKGMKTAHPKRSRKWLAVSLAVALLTGLLGLIIWFIALLLFGGGSGIGGPGGLGFGTEAGTGGGVKTVEVGKNHSDSTTSGITAQTPAGGILRIEVLGQPALSKSDFQAERWYRIEMTEVPRLLTFNEVKKAVQKRQQEQPPLRRIEIMLYKDNPDEHVPIVGRLKAWAVDLDGGKMQVDVSQPEAEAPRK